MYNDIILQGIKAGDKNGGPYQLSKILNSSLVTYNSFNKNVLISVWYHPFLKHVHL